MSNPPGPVTVWNSEAEEPTPLMLPRGEVNTSAGAYVCDRCGAVLVVPMPVANVAPPSPWVAVGSRRTAARDFCTARCAALALGREAMPTVRDGS